MAIDAMREILANPLQMLLDLNKTMRQVLVRKRLTDLGCHPKNFSHGDARKTVKKSSIHHNYSE
jgi:hypothetical protein